MDSAGSCACMAFCFAHMAKHTRLLVHFFIFVEPNSGMHNELRWRLFVKASYPNALGTSVSTVRLNGKQFLATIFASTQLLNTSAQGDLTIEFRCSTRTYFAHDLLCELSLSFLLVRCWLLGFAARSSDPHPCNLLSCRDLSYLFPFILITSLIKSFF